MLLGGIVFTVPRPSSAASVYNLTAMSFKPASSASNAWFMRNLHFCNSDWCKGSGL